MEQERVSVKDVARGGREAHRQPDGQTGKQIDRCCREADRKADRQVL